MGARFVLCSLIAVALTATAADRPEGRWPATRSVTVARQGMVAAAHPLAVLVGLDILRRGGSAVDAAIAVNAALTFLEPVACGLGGDLFAIVWDPASGRLHGLNAAGAAPRALTPERIPAEPDGTIPLRSPYAWTVPGCVDGWHTLHGRFGRLPWSEVLKPAADLARQGAPVPQVIAGAWARAPRIFGDKPGFSQVFLPGGKAPAEGEIFANPALAHTIDMLAREGRNAFYEGEIARSIVRFSREVGGFFDLEDLAGHSSEWVEPVATTYRDVTVHELPPPGQGVAALQILNILENFDLRSLGRENPDFWHLLVEAKKLAFEDRARLYADPAMVAVPVEELLSKERALRQAARIELRRAAMVITPDDSRLSRGDTTYLAVADSQGMMVSLIQSNYTGFGSGYTIAELGFGIHNRGSQFSLRPDHPNVLAPAKRPFHTIIPAFLSRHGVPLMVFGVMGGDMQPQGHAQVVVNLVDLGMNVQEAGDAARFYHSGSSTPTGLVMEDGGLLHLESGVSTQVRQELLRRGHRLVEATGTAFGGYQAVWRDPHTGVYHGATEARKDGLALGY
jgi:gamma-glutamyltranspeptidase/glutathione hydrolase